MNRVVRVCVGSVVSAAALCLAACGWTPRDEFFLEREVTLRPQPGDGSEIGMNWKDRQVQQARGPGVASRWEQP